MQEWLASNGTKNCSLGAVNPPLENCFSLCCEEYLEE